MPLVSFSGVSRQRRTQLAQGKNFVNLSSKFTIQKSTSVTEVKAEPWPLSQVSRATFGILEEIHVVARPFLERGVAPDHSLVTRQRRSGATRVAYFLHHQYWQACEKSTSVPCRQGLLSFWGVAPAALKQENQRPGATGNSLDRSKLSSKRADLKEYVRN